MFEEYVLPSPKYQSRSFQCLYLYFHLYGSVSSIDCPVVDVSKRKNTGIVCIGELLAHFWRHGRIEVVLYPPCSTWEWWPRVLSAQPLDLSTPQHPVPSSRLESLSARTSWRNLTGPSSSSCLALPSWPWSSWSCCWYAVCFFLLSSVWAAGHCWILGRCALGPFSGISGAVCFVMWNSSCLYGCVITWSQLVWFSESLEVGI